MKHFARSFKYVFAYKARVAGAIVCAGLIGVLWAGGLGALVPAAKVLLSEEGLHGWADQELVTGQLGLTTMRLQVSDVDLIKRWDGVTEVAAVTALEEPSPAGETLKPGDWLIGMDGQPMAHDAIYEAMARSAARKTWELTVYDPVANRQRRATVHPGQPDRKVLFLWRLAQKLPRPEQRQDRYILLLWLLGVMLVLTAIRDVMRFAQDYMVQTSVFRAVMDIRQDNYAVAIRLPLGYYSSHGTSDTMSRFVEDVNTLTRGLTTLLGKTLVEPSKLLFTFALALLLNWKLTVLACVAGPPSYVLIRKLGKLIRRASKRALENQADMLRSLGETLVGIRVVKASTSEEHEERRFRSLTRRLYKQLKRVAVADAATGPAIELLGSAASVLAAGLAGYWVFHTGQKHTGLASWLLDNPIDSEKFLAMLGVLAAMFDPVRKLSKVTSRFYAADAAGQRVFGLMDTPVEAEKPGAVNLPRHEKAIEFRNLSFTYPGAAVPALRDVQLTIDQAQSVAVVGANGSGKTTLLSMLPRFFLPSAGQVLIDGVDIADVTLASLRHQMAVVTQETVIFNAPVADNIAYGSPDATREQIVQAARQAFADEFIRNMPDGYDSIVGEHGATLSGGQRQRIAIARAILRDPAVLIFDEAMSQIDSESEAKIHQALETFMAGRTTLMIAHRFSTVISADRVVVMDAGRVVDVGSHEELLARCAIYRTLFETQLTRPPGIG